MRKFLTYIFLIFFSVFLLGTNVYAKKSLNDATPSLTKVNSQTGITESEFGNVAGNVVNMLFIFAGLLFFVLMVYAGVRWMTAREKPESVEKARNTMIAAVIGLVILMAAYAITNFVQSNIVSKNLDNSGSGGGTSTLSCTSGSANVSDFCNSSCKIDSLNTENCISSGSSASDTDCFLFCSANFEGTACQAVSEPARRNSCAGFTNTACQSIQSRNNLCQLK